MEISLQDIASWDSLPWNIRSSFKTRKFLRAHYQTRPVFLWHVFIDSDHSRNVSGPWRGELDSYGLIRITDLVSSPLRHTCLYVQADAHIAPARALCKGGKGEWQYGEWQYVYQYADEISVHVLHAFAARMTAIMQEEENQSFAARMTAIMQEHLRANARNARLR